MKLAILQKPVNEMPTAYKVYVYTIYALAFTTILIGLWL